MDTRSKRAVVPGPMKPNGLSSEAPVSIFSSNLKYYKLLFITNL